MQRAPEGTYWDFTQAAWVAARADDEAQVDGERASADDEAVPRGESVTQLT